MRCFAVAICCCILFAASSSLCAAQPGGGPSNSTERPTNGQNSRGPQREGGSSSRGNENTSRENSRKPDDGGTTGSRAGSAYFYASEAFRLRKILPDGTLLLVSEIKAYDWTTEKYYDVLKKVSLIGLRAPKSGDLCFQEYLARLEQLAAYTALTLEHDSAVQSPDQTVSPVYLWIENKQLINLQLLREGYVAAQIESYQRQEQFLKAQQEAQQQQRGIWDPEAQQCTAVPLVMPLPEQTSSTTQQKCLIKGLIGSDKTLRYCLSPGEKNYNVIKINEAAGERWFCTKEEARKAGWSCY